MMGVDISVWFFFVLFFLFHSFNPYIFYVQISKHEKKTLYESYKQKRMYKISLFSFFLLLSPFTNQRGSYKFSHLLTYTTSTTDHPPPPATSTTAARLPRAAAARAPWAWRRRRPWAPCCTCRPPSACTRCGGRRTRRCCWARRWQRRRGRATPPPPPPGRAVEWKHTARLPGEIAFTYHLSNTQEMLHFYDAKAFSFPYLSICAESFHFKKICAESG